MFRAKQRAEFAFEKFRHAMPVALRGQRLVAGQRVAAQVGVTLLEAFHLAAQRGGDGRGGPAFGRQAPHVFFLAQQALGDQAPLVGMRGEGEAAELERHKLKIGFCALLLAEQKEELLKDFEEAAQPVKQIIEAIDMESRAVSATRLPGGLSGKAVFRILLK